MSILYRQLREVHLLIFQNFEHILHPWFQAGELHTGGGCKNSVQDAMLTFCQHIGLWNNASFQQREGWAIGGDKKYTLAMLRFCQHIQLRQNGCIT